MAGIKNSTEKLNKTLLFIAKLLIDNNITNWFIGYGTLLGIIRENNCINGDDDIDIIIDDRYFDDIHALLAKNNITTTKRFGINNSRSIIKTVDTNEYASIDFYCAKYNKYTTSFNDVWEKVEWSNCKNNNNSFNTVKWNNIDLNIPCNHEIKLERRYGKNWRIPQNNKGPNPRLKII
jgi:hypothetical protein